MNLGRIAVCAVALITFVLALGLPAAAEDVKSGTLTMSSWKVAFIGSGGQSKGVLNYGGKSRKFKMTGIGYGGVGVSTSQATGVVYNMKSADDFLGTYSSARAGVTLGDDELMKDRTFWLINQNGVKIKLISEKDGVELNLGVDGSVVTWND
jgi:hypothetical protein